MSLQLQEEEAPDQRGDTQHPADHVQASNVEFSQTWAGEEFVQTCRIIQFNVITGYTVCTGCTYILCARFCVQGLTKMLMVRASLMMLDVGHVS